MSLSAILRGLSAADSSEVEAPKCGRITSESSAQLALEEDARFSERSMAVVVAMLINEVPPKASRMLCVLDLYIGGKPPSLPCAGAAHAPSPCPASPLQPSRHSACGRPGVQFDTLSQAWPDGVAARLVLFLESLELVIEQPSATSGALPPQSRAAAAAGVAPRSPVTPAAVGEASSGRRLLDSWFAVTTAGHALTAQLRTRLGDIQDLCARSPPVHVPSAPSPLPLSPRALTTRPNHTAARSVVSWAHERAQVRCAHVRAAAVGDGWGTVPCGIVWDTVPCGMQVCVCVRAPAIGDRWWHHDDGRKARLGVALAARQVRADAVGLLRRRPVGRASKVQPLLPFHGGCVGMCHVQQSIGHGPAGYSETV
jgi:hypothetical protein